MEKERGRIGDDRHLTSRVFISCVEAAAAAAAAEKQNYDDVQCRPPSSPLRSVPSKMGQKRGSLSYIYLATYTHPAARQEEKNHHFTRFSDAALAHKT